MEFVKMEGLANDFIVVPGRIDPTRDQIAAWCERRTGIGADGVLEMTPADRARVRMRYWNSDGSPAEMCGNGLRCVARLAVLRDWVDGPAFTVETAAGDRPVDVRPDGSVRALVGVPHDHRVRELAVAGTRVHPVGLGNPHAVLFVDDVTEAKVGTLGPKIEHDPIFPDGANVEFTQVIDEHRIALRVWERGSGETLACGTGAAAAAFVAHSREWTGPRVTVDQPGGSLEIEIDDDGVWMEGPAHVVFAGTLP
jgi:diaminopimelate epimerase